MYDVNSIISAKLAEVQSTISSKLSNITSTTGIPFSIVMQNATAAASSAAEPEIVDAADLVKAKQAQAEPPVSDTAAAEAGSDISSLAVQAGSQYNVDPSLILALIQAESGGRTDAVSGAGAMGLMQLMPSTAEGLGVDNPFDAGQNIDGGTRLLSSLLQRYDGNVNLAVAAYNLGVGGLSKYDVGSLGSSDELSILPGQTQSLISNVWRYLLQYGYSAS